MKTAVLETEARAVGAHVAAALINVLVLLVANLHRVWRPWTGGIVTEEWALVLWIVNLTALLQISGNALLAAWRPLWLERFLELVFAVAGFAGAVTFLRVFPFDFSRLADWANPAAHVLLVAGVVAAGFAVAVRLVMLALGPPGPHERLPPARHA